MKYLFGKQALILLFSLLIMVISSCESSSMLSSTTAKSTTSHDEHTLIGEKLGIVFYKTTVRIYNALDDNLNLTVHCKSKNDDLGVHVVSSNNFYQWKFRINVWGTTLFFCGLNWRNVSGTFDIFVADRDQGRCRSKCYWRVSKDGVHGYRNTSPYPSPPDLSFTWPINPYLNSSSK